MTIVREVVVVRMTTTMTVLDHCCYRTDRVCPAKEKTTVSLCADHCCDDRVSNYDSWRWESVVDSLWARVWCCDCVAREATTMTTTPVVVSCYRGYLLLLLLHCRMSSSRELDSRVPQFVPRAVTLKNLL